MKTHDKTLNEMACGLTSLIQGQLKSEEENNKFLMLKTTQLASRLFEE